MTATLYVPQVRFMQEFGDLSAKDWVHDDSSDTAYATKEEAEAALPAMVTESVACWDMEDEEKASWERIDHSNYDSGFWFTTSNGDEGRALVREIKLA